LGTFARQCPPPLHPRGQGLWIHKAANLSQGIHITIESVTAERLGLRALNPAILVDVQHEEGVVVNENLRIIDNALHHVVNQRTHLGAMQNRLEYAAENAALAGENLNLANSRIRDADMAGEMMRFTMSNVLQQAAMSLLAQAQQTTQAVLQLLR